MKETKKTHVSFNEKPVEFAGKTYKSYTEAAKDLNLSIGAISKRMATHGTLDISKGNTKEVLTSGVLGKVYKTTKEAKEDLNVRTSWSVFASRVVKGVDVDIAKDDKAYKKWRNEFKMKHGSKFKEPVEIDGKTYDYWGDLNEAYKDKIGTIASSQTIRKRKAQGITGLDLIIDKTHDRRN